MAEDFFNAPLRVVHHKETSWPGTVRHESSHDKLRKYKALVGRIELERGSPIRRYSPAPEQVLEPEREVQPKRRTLPTLPALDFSSLQGSPDTPLPSITSGASARRVTRPRQSGAGSGSSRPNTREERRRRRYKSRARSSSDGAPKFDPAPQLDWARMRPYELKKHCRSRGLADDGPKRTLVGRLDGSLVEKPPTPVAMAGVELNDPEVETGAAQAAALVEAAKKGSVEDIQALLASGVSVDVVDGKGYTPLYCATMYEKEEAVVVLLAAGAEVDKENNNGVPPLMAAARDGYTTIVGHLLAAGADYTQVDEFGRTAASIAEDKGHPETATILTEWAATHPSATQVVAESEPAAVAESGGEGTRPNSRNSLGTRGSSSHQSAAVADPRASWSLRPSTSESQQRPGTSQSSASSFHLDMPSFRMTWCAGAAPDALDSSSGSSAFLSPEQQREHARKARRDLERQSRSISFSKGKREERRPPATPRQFFGAESRMQFFKLYAEKADLWGQEGAPSKEELRQSSARTIFLGKVRQTQSLPLPALINRCERPSSVINLNGHHIGDQTAAAWAAALPRMQEQGVELTELRLKENSLKTLGLRALTDALGQCSGLLLLDLSLNDLSGESGLLLARALAAMQQQLELTSAMGGCILEELQLENSKLGDRNAKAIVVAVSTGFTQLRRLDLSHNSLGAGSLEGQRGKGACSALASYLLGPPACPLDQLDLSYNQLLGSHAEALSKSLEYNERLRRLDLSWNGLGDGGVMALVSCLRSNSSLEFLNLSKVEMRERGCMVLSDVLKENKALKTIIISDNPIGQRGGRAVLRAMRHNIKFAWQRDIDISGCNFDYQDASEDLFDPAEPAGKYELDLGDCYERMVAWELVELAWEEDGENWADETLDHGEFNLEEPPLGVDWTRDDWQLPQSGVLRLT